MPKWKQDVARFLLLPASELVQTAGACDEFAKLYIATLRWCCESYDSEFGMDEFFLLPRYK